MSLWYNNGISTDQTPAPLRADRGVSKPSRRSTMSDCTTLKRCAKCGREYPATSKYFVSNKSEPSGFHSYCKQCWRKRQSEIRDRSRTSTVLLPDGYRVCGDCLTLLPADREHFSTNKLGKNGLNSICKPCAAKRQKKYRHDHPDKVKATETKRDAAERRVASKRSYARNITKRRAVKRLYQIEHPDKIKANTQKQRARRRDAPGEYTGDDLKELYQLQNGKCWWCERDLDGEYEPDHRVPICKGGTNHIGNIVLACRECNRSKAGRMPWEWIGRLL